MLRAAAGLLLALGIAFASAAPTAAEEPVFVDLEVVAADTITVGDRLLYVVTLEADTGTEFALVQASLPREVEVIGAPETRTRSLGGGRIEVRMTFWLAPFVPGDLIVPPLTLRYFGGNGEPGTLTTPATRFNVASVLPPGQEIVPRDLKPQAELDFGSPGWVMPVVVAAVLALVLLCGLMYWRIRVLQRRAAYVPDHVAVEEAPEDRARRVLDKAGADFGADRDYVAYYAAIAETVRTYLTERHGFPAFALTTRELEQEMLRRGLDRWQVRVAGGLLEQCDSVVYAHYRPAAERADADLTAAYEIVEMSRPEPRVAVGVAP